MKFLNDKHQEFYEEVLLEYNQYGGSIDCYSKSFFYLMGLCKDTRNNFSTLFDMKKRGIKTTGLNFGWQTGTTVKITRLAFNLWNGCVYESDEDYEENSVSKYFSVDEIFCCSYATYFFEAIKLRYPEYC